MHFHGPDGPYKVSFSNQIFNVSAFLVKELQVEVEFPRCLSRLNSLHCQDIRDRIYSTRTLIDWSLFGQIQPVPDYRKSPFDLALQLVSMLVNTEFRSVQIIAETLDLSNPSTTSEVLEELQAHRQRTKPYKADSVRYRQWHSTLDHGQMIQQDATGRPIVTLKSSNGSSRPASNLDLSDLSRETLAACRMVPIYEGGVLAAVVSDHMRPGDIIVQSLRYGLVLRPHDDGNKFVFVGDAFISNGFELAARAPFADKCYRHWYLWPSTDDRKKEFVEVAIELSDGEILAAFVSRMALENGGCDISEYLESGTFGETRAGSYVWDATVESMYNKHSARPRQPPCNVHRAGDYYWRFQKFFWYSIVTGAGFGLVFSEDDRTQASCDWRE